MDYRNYYRADARRRRRRRGLRRFGFFFLLLLFLMVLAAVITWLIEAVTGSPAGASSGLPPQPPASSTPAASQPGSSSAAGPAGAPLPELGRVELAYFADAAFVGDSITLGWVDYAAAAALPQTNVVAAIGATPPVNGALWMPDGETDPQAAYDPLQAIVQAAPTKLYLMFGANKLVDTSELAEETLLADYAEFLDALKAQLPGAQIYLQSILPPTAQAAQGQAGLSAQRIARVNERLQALAAEKGCYYLDLAGALCPGGALDSRYAAADGLHLNRDGYMAWLEYLITHAAYRPDNPYVGGIDPMG